MLYIQKYIQHENAVVDGAARRHFPPTMSRNPILIRENAQRGATGERTPPKNDTSCKKPPSYNVP